MLTYAYAVAFAYCIGDVAYVGYKESKKEDGNVPRAVAFQTTFQVVQYKSTNIDDAAAGTQVQILTQAALSGPRIYCSAVPYHPHSRAPVA